MEICRIHTPAALTVQGASVVALGFFDGVHRGHVALLERARQEAAARGVAFAVFSFADEGGIKAGAPRLTGEEERISLLEAAGVERLYLFDFAAVRDLSPADFVKDILLDRLACVAAVCGFNFRFGKGGAGDVEMLSALLSAKGVPTVVLPPYEEGGVAVSSSVIRAAVENGEAERAAFLLGRPYAFTGEVVHGHALGREMGYPTANIMPPVGRVIPAHGVYAVSCAIDGVGALPAVANVGVRPTVEEDACVNCEVHLLAPVSDLYGKRLTVSFLSRLREEKKFESTAALAKQIAADIENAKEYHKQWLNGQN